MNAKELILKADIDELVDWIWQHDKRKGAVTPEFRQALNKLILDISKIEPIKNDNSIAAKEFDDHHLDVFAVEPAGQDFSLLFVKWEEVLGYSVPDELIAKLGIIKLAAGLLYELTWFGSTDEENNKAIAEFEEDCRKNSQA